MTAPLAAWLLTRAVLLATVWLFDADDDITELAWTWSQDVLDGWSPWHDVAVAYPPLAMLGFAVPGVVASGPDEYALPFALGILAVDFIGARAGGMRYVLAVPAVGPVLLLWRYDLLPAVCHLVALTAALKGRRGWSWWWLGVGIALKPYLVVVVPLWLLWDRSPRALLALVPSGAAALLMLPIAGWEVLAPYLFQGQRALSVESGPAIVAGILGLGEVSLDQACLCWVRAGAGPTWIGWALCALALPLAWRTRDLVRGSVAAIAILLLFAPVFSPQFLVWLLPPAALLGGPALALTAAAGFTGFLAYPLLYDEVLSGTADPLLALRLALLAGVAIASTRGEFWGPGAYEGYARQLWTRLQPRPGAARSGGDLAAPD